MVFDEQKKEKTRFEPIDGFTDGVDYKIACDMAELFASEHGWSHTRRYPKSTRYVRFNYEFYMSKRGAKDSRNPALQIRVMFSGGHKAVGLYRNGDWTAIFGIYKDGSACDGQYDGETGIEDLLILRELYRKVKDK